VMRRFDQDCRLRYTRESSTITDRRHFHLLNRFGADLNGESNINRLVMPCRQYYPMQLHT
jgi:hypothetical protein